MKKTICSLGKFTGLKKLDITLCNWEPLSGFGTLNDLEFPEDLGYLVGLEQLKFTCMSIFDWSMLSGMKQLKKLAIHCIGAKNIEQIPKKILRGLHELTNSCNTPIPTDILPQISNLRVLYLYSPNFEVLKYLPTSLEKLVIYDMRGDLNHFQYIQRFPLLEKLKFYIAQEFRSSMMKYFAKLNNLRKLTFMGTSRFSPESLNDLSGLNKLERITININKHITEDSIPKALVSKVKLTNRILIEEVP